MATTPYFRHVSRAPGGAAGQLARESWTMQAARCKTAVEAVLPDAALELYFNLGPAGRHLGDATHSTPARPRAAWVIGPRERPVLIEKEIQDCDIVGVRLHAGTALQVLGVPANELRGAMVDLDVFWGHAVDDIRDQLFHSPDPSARLAIVEQAIADRRASDTPCEEATLARALCQVLAGSAHHSIGQLAASTGLSHRRVIGLFDRAVGLKPKTFHRVQRLRRVFQLVDLTPRPSWTAIAHRSGFYDQAHMINDFRALTGLSPGDYAGTHSSVGQGFVPHRLAAPR